MVKNTIPTYSHPEERDMILKKQYHTLQKRFYDEASAEKGKRAERKGGRER